MSKPGKILTEKSRYIRETLDELYPVTPIPLQPPGSLTRSWWRFCLSAQCTDERVNQITPLLFARADNPFDMAKVPVEEIQAIIRPCGLSPAKSKAISGLSQILVEKYQGNVPQTFRRTGGPPRRRAQDGLRGDVAGIRFSGIPGGYTYTPAGPALGTHFRQKRWNRLNAI
jgi:hypothetical protein